MLRGTTWFNLTQAFPTEDILAERSLAVPDSAFAPPTRDEDNRLTRVERNQPQATGSYYTCLDAIPMAGLISIPPMTIDLRVKCMRAGVD